MAIRIPTYDARLVADGRLGARASGVGVDDSMGRALGNLGQAVDQTANEYIRSVTEARAREIDNEASDALRQILNGSIDADGNPTKGYYATSGEETIKDYAATVERVKTLQRDLMSRATNGPERRALEQVLNRRVEAAMGGISTHAAQQAEVYNANQAKARAVRAGQDALANYTDPAQFDEFARQMVIEGTFGQSGDQAAATATDLRTRLHGGVIDTMLSKGDIKGATAWLAQRKGEIDPFAQDDFQNRIRVAIAAQEAEARRREAEARARQAEYRERLRERITDQTAMIMSGLPLERPISRREFAAAGMAEDYGNYANLVQMGADIVSLNGMSGAEIGQFLSDRAPVPTEEGFANRSRLYGTLAERAQAIVKAREADPGGYLVQQSASAREAYAALTTAQTPQEARAAAQDFAVKATAESRRLGIQNPAILPKAFADQLVAQFHRQGQPGEAAAQTLLAERERWGRYWPQVYAQIAPALPGTAAVIGLGMSAGPAGRLAEVGLLKEEELNRLLPAGTSPKSLRDGVNDAMGDMQASLIGQPGADQMLVTLKDAAYRLAVRYRASGKSESEAARQAADEVVNERYQFSEVRNGGVLRIPRAVDADAVSTALRIVWNRDVAPLDYAQLDGATWRTWADRRSADEVGVELVYNGKVVPFKDGRPIRYTWAELMNRKATQEEQARADAAAARARSLQ